MGKVSRLANLFGSVVQLYRRELLKSFTNHGLVRSKSQSLSDVTYEVLDVGRKTNKIVHFDRLKKSTVKTRAHVLSENKIEDKMSSKTESTDSETTAAKMTPKPITHKKSLSCNRKNTKAINPGSADTFSAPASQVAPAETQPSDIADQLVDSSKRRVSERSNQGQTPSRFATSGYLLVVCLIIFVFCTLAIKVIPVSPWSELDGEEMPIVDNKILWHPL